MGLGVVKVDWDLRWRGSQCHDCMNVAWVVIWGKNRSTKPSAVVSTVPPLCSAMSGCSCVRDSC